MSVLDTKAVVLATEQSCKYSGLSVIQLAERIVRCSDEEALKELHDRRPLFRLHDGPPRLLAEFVSLLSSSPWAIRFASGNAMILDRAHDLTIDKFSVMPLADAPPERRNRGPDCRKYFQAFLVLWSKYSRTAPMNEVGSEMASVKLLQTRVVRSFRLSCLEARRRMDPTRTRYAWEANGIAVYVWMPTAMPGRCRRAWLEENVGIPNASSKDERRRVQAIIDERLGVKTHFPLDERFAPIDKSLLEPGLECLVEDEVGGRGLAEVVADEKAHNIRKQRPAIQALGQSALKRLVLRVFGDLANGQYEERQIAESFGLSTPTLSRFAGCRWCRDTEAKPPDLWANVARTIAGHRDFADAAREAGVWPLVQKTASREQRTITSGAEP